MKWKKTREDARGLVHHYYISNVFFCCTKFIHIPIVFPIIYFAFLRQMEGAEEKPDDHHA